MKANLQLIEVIGSDFLRHEAYTKESVHAVLVEIAQEMRAAGLDLDGTHPPTIEDFTAPSTVGEPPKELEEGYPA